MSTSFDEARERGAAIRAGEQRAVSHDSSLSSSTREPPASNQNRKSRRNMLARAPRSLFSWSKMNPFDHRPHLDVSLLDEDHYRALTIDEDAELGDEAATTPTNEMPGTIANDTTPNSQISDTSQHGGKSSQLNVTLNFLNTIVGAGIVGLPYVFRSAGFYTGLFLLCLGSFLTDYSVRLLVTTGMRHGQRNYEDLCEHALGKFGHGLVSLCMLIFDSGACLSYLIIMGDAGTLVAQHALNKEPSDGGEDNSIRRITICTLSVLFILPLCLFRDVSRLEKAATFSVVTVFFVIGIVFYELVDKGMPPNAGDLSVFRTSGFFSAFGIVSFAFVCHDSAFLLNNTLKDNHITRRWANITHGALGSALVICLALAVPGYLTFRDDTCQNLLTNYPSGEVPIIILRAIYVLTMASTYPISFFVVRHISNVAIFGGTKHFRSIQEMSLFRHLCLTLPIFFVSVGIVMFVKKLGVVMAVAGSLGGGMLAFVLPPLCHIVLSDYSVLFWRNEGHMWISVRRLGPPLMLLMFGVAAIPLTIYETMAGVEDGC